MEFRTEYEQAKCIVEADLNRRFAGDGPQRQLWDSMRYSLLAGGKRIRPVLTLKFCEMLCGEMSYAADYASAVEMLHTYSLIHDDLPCMDNDDLRRGKPTCHKVYGEQTAVLAGDALQAEAFYCIATSKKASRAGSNEQACAVLSEAAGALSGICAGQFLDLKDETGHKTEDELACIHGWKTAALLKASCLLGLAASSVEPSQEQWAAACRYAEELGMAFQIRDDMLDEESTTEELGKPVGSDASNQKTTFATLLGLNECRRRVQQHTDSAKASITAVFEDTDFLCWLADELAGRRN